MQLPPEVAQADRDDQALALAGEEATGRLAERRYEWCEVRGMTQRAYAAQVGVDPGAVAQSINLHRSRLPRAEVTQHKPVGTPRQVAAKVRERTKREARATVTPIRREKRGGKRVAVFAASIGGMAQSFLAWKPRAADDTDELRHLADCLRTLETQARAMRGTIERALNESEGNTQHVRQAQP